MMSGFHPERINIATWPAIYRVLGSAVARSAVSPRELVDELIDNTAQLWVLRKGGDPVAAAVSELVRTPAGLVVHGRLCAGRGMAAWVDDLIACITTHAKTVGAIGIEIEGRAGWERVLSKRGWNRKAVVMERRLEREIVA